MALKHSIQLFFLVNISQETKDYISETTLTEFNFWAPVAWYLTAYIICSCGLVCLVTGNSSQTTFICSKSTIETLEKGVEYVQN